MLSQLFTVAAVATLALAKTDYEGCTSSTTVVYGGASVMYWDPTNGEICQYLDCGGGRAPPKTNVPGCAAYEGTETYSPSYLPGWSSATATPSSSAMAYPTATPSSSSEMSASSSFSSSAAEMYSTMSTSAVVTSAYSTMTTAMPIVPSGSMVTAPSGGAYPTGANGTSVESPTLSASSGGPAQQTGNAAVALGAKRVLVGAVAGVFGLAML
jgi:hypothetical protein